MQLATFDIDGTLTDTNAADNACFLQAFEESLGIRDIDTDWTSYRYSTDSGIVSEILEKHRGRADAKDIEVLQTRFVELLGERFKTRPLQPIPRSTRSAAAARGGAGLVVRDCDRRLA